MTPVRRMLLGSLIIAACFLVAWLLAGRRISILLDQLFTVRHAALPASPLVYEEGAFWISGVPMSFGGPDDAPTDLRVQRDSSDRLVISTAGHSLTLGTSAASQDSSRPAGIEIAPETGDEVSFTIKRSFLSWPTPFEFNFMTGQSPSWKRNLYFHLLWKKRSGAQLEMIWRYQQWFYGSQGWASGMMTGPGTGLIQVDIRP
jgi:hypothetical protein